MLVATNAISYRPCGVKFVEAYDGEFYELYFSLLTPENHEHEAQALTKCKRVMFHTEYKQLKKLYKIETHRDFYKALKNITMNYHEILETVVRGEKHTVYTNHVHDETIISFEEYLPEHVGNSHKICTKFIRRLIRRNKHYMSMADDQFSPVYNDFLKRYVARDVSIARAAFDLDHTGSFVTNDTWIIKGLTKLGYPSQTCIGGREFLV